MNTFARKYLKYFIGIILLIFVIVLWFQDYKNQSINVMIIGLAIWSLKFILNHHFQRIDKKIDHQNQLILQKAKGGVGFQQYVLQNMYNVTLELWKQSIWIGDHWNVLFPGFEKDIKERNNFNKRFDEYRFLLKSNLINIPSEIYKGFDDLIKGINKYNHGRNLRDGAYGEPTKKHTREAVDSMTVGSKMVEDSMINLSSTIRKEFGMDNLPGELIDIKQPKDLEE